MMDQSEYWPRQRAIVTAGAAGIGLSIATALHQAGAQVWICDIEAEKLTAASKALPGIGTMICDVSDPSAADRFVAAAVEAMGGLDILINNVGIAGPAAPVEEIRTDDWTRTFAVNVHGQFFMARAAVPHLKKA